MYLELALPLALSALIASRLLPNNWQTPLPYIFFFISPVLTYFGAIGILSGFDGTNINNRFFGVTFYSIFIALQLSLNSELLQTRKTAFIVSAINPIYLFTGPIPQRVITSKTTFRRALKKARRRFSVTHTDLILGIFFAAILAPPLAGFLYLKESTGAIDVLTFGLIFELYVYYNFAGFSMIAWSAMRTFGIDVPRNFQQPFGARSIIEYWQRWHRSLSLALKYLFFNKFRPCLGIAGGTTAVFICSALWHGVSLSFILWGLFHASCWLLAYGAAKKKIPGANLLLLPFAIIIGRIIFAETNIEILFEKLTNIVTQNGWRTPVTVEIDYPGTRLLINLSVAAGLVLMEIAMPRLGFTKRQYEHLRNRWTLALIAIYSALTFTGFSSPPIYGER